MRVDRATIKAGAGGVLERQITPTQLGTGIPSVTSVTEGESSTRPAPTPIPSGSTTTTGTNSTNSANSANSDSTAASKYENRQRIILALRVEALRLSGEIEEMQGSPERRDRLNSLALKLEAGQDG